MFESLVCNW